MPNFAHPIPTMIGQTSPIEIDVFGRGLPDEGYFQGLLLALYRRSVVFSIFAPIGVYLIKGGQFSNWRDIQQFVPSSSPFKISKEELFP